MSLETGAIVEGTVTGVTNFGAFVELPEGKTGMVHISEISDSYVENIHDHLKEKDKVQVKILGINEKGKFDLSIKQVNAPPDIDAFRGRPRKGKPVFEKSGPVTFEDKLTKFLKESEERLLDLKRNTEAKRGRGRSNK
jgi:S1 RNA binding domain protein